MKKCQKCKEVKPFEEFGKRKDSSDGHTGTCKVCSNKRLKDRRSGKLDNELKHSRDLKIRRENMPFDIGICASCDIEFEITCEGRKSHCKKCTNLKSREKYNLSEKNNKKQYYIDNKEHITIKRAERYRDNPEYQKSYSKDYGPLWDNRNRGKRRAITRNYQASKLNATPPWITKEMLLDIEDFYIEAVNLTEKSGVIHHVDHIMPLQGEKSCGLHVPWNLQVMEATKNCSKGNRIENEAFALFD